VVTGVIEFEDAAVIGTVLPFSTSGGDRLDLDGAHQRAVGTLRIAAASVSVLLRPASGHDGKPRPSADAPPARTRERGGPWYQRSAASRLLSYSRNV